MMRKGQAAMEFLMTYGWAILVVLAAIAALAAFGVLDAGSNTPEITTFAAPIQNVDNAVVRNVADATNQDTVELALVNNKGGAIRFKDADITLAGDCTIGTTAPALTGSTDFTIDNTIANGEEFILTFTCAENLASTQRVDIDVTIEYETISSGLHRPHTGSIQATVI